MVGTVGKAVRPVTHWTLLGRCGSVSEPGRRCAPGEILCPPNLPIFFLWVGLLVSHLTFPGDSQADCYFHLLGGIVGFTPCFLS